MWSTGGETRTSELTGRQKQILDLLATNMTSKEIALCLGIQSRTVDNHCVNIIRILGVRDRFDAVRFWSRVTAGQTARSHEYASI